MAYDERVAERLRAAFTRTLGPSDDIEERKMFGGIAELVNGHMAVGVLGSELIVHGRAEDGAALLARPHARPMDFTGRPMRGWLYVAPEGFATDADLDGWVRVALEFVRAAGPKKAGSPMKRRPAAPRGGLKTPVWPTPSRPAEKASPKPRSPAKKK